MARRITEARAAGVSKWVVDHTNRRRLYSPPKGQKLRKELRHERKSLAGRYYLLLSGHAATGGYLYRRMHRLPSDRCWWCGRDERQSRHHLFVSCEARKSQIQELWKEVGRFCGWKHPKALRMALLFKDEKATKAVLSFLCKTRVGQMVTTPPRDGGGEEEGQEGRYAIGTRDKAEAEEGGPGPPPRKFDKGRGRKWAAFRVYGRGE